MNKKELAVKLASQTGLTQVKSMEVLNALFDANEGIIGGELVGGGKVSIPGFGTFKVKTRTARKGRNPRTGAEITIKASKTVTFKPAPSFKGDL